MLTKLAVCVFVCFHVWFWKTPKLKCHILNLAVIMKGEPRLIAFRAVWSVSFWLCVSFCLFLVKSLAQAPSVVNPLCSCDSEISLLSSSCRLPTLWMPLQCSQSKHCRTISLGFHWLMALDEVTKAGIVFCYYSHKDWHQIISDRFCSSFLSCF